MNAHNRKKGITKKKVPEWVHNMMLKIINLNDAM